MFGERLHIARKKSGLSLRALAEALNGRVSAQALGKYERGEMMPNSDVLIALCDALEVSPEFLLSEQVQRLDEVEFRKTSGTTVKERYRVEAEVIEQLERYLTVEELLGLDSHEWHKPFPRQEVNNIEQAETVADKLREAWGLGQDPIPNMTELLEEHGLKVLALSLPDNVSGLTCLVHRAKGQPVLPVIVVNASKSLERRRLTLAHELAHRLLAAAPALDDEKVANRFAGAFLMPMAHLREKMGGQRHGLSYEEIRALKRHYRVSAAAFIVRLRDIGIITQATLRYAFQTMAKRWRREEPDPLERAGLPPEELPERFKRLCYRALAERLISPAKAVELLKMSLAAIEIAMRGPVVADENHC